MTGNCPGIPENDLALVRANGQVTSQPMATPKHGVRREAKRHAALTENRARQSPHITGFQPSNIMTTHDHGQVPKALWTAASHRRFERLTTFINATSRPRPIWVTTAATYSE